MISKVKVINVTRINNSSATVIFFGLLPLIDTLNGFFTTWPIGICYKLALCLVLFLSGISKHSIYNKYLTIILGSLIYIGISVTINVLFGGSVIEKAFPIKLIFNIILLCLLLNNCRKKLITGKTIYSILEISSWVFIGCYLVPYCLGVGNRVYGGDMGYKAFFISQNELGVLVTVMVFFTVYKLIQSIHIKDIICLALLFLSGMLLNTKTTIIACLLAISLWLIPVLFKSKLRVKFITLAITAMGFVLLKNRIYGAIDASINRYSQLLTKYYGGSAVTGFLSGRDILLKRAWSEFIQEHTVMRLAIGNGFCSEVLIEMDIFDIFFYLGIFGVVGIILFAIRVFSECKKVAKYDKSMFRPISFVILMALLSFAGHVIFMSMSGCYFVLYVCFLMLYRQEFNRDSREVKVKCNEWRFISINNYAGL